MIKKKKIGLVTAWGECGMGYVAKNWVHTFNKHQSKLDYQIYSRAHAWLTPFRWTGKNVINGYESMDINNKHFWNWIDEFQPDIIIFQDQNIYSKSQMQEEVLKLKKMGIKLINYPDWIKRGDIEKYKGLYDINLSHVKRNHKWLVDAQVENPIYIPWGVITGNFPFSKRQVKDKVRFYINIGTGTQRKGYFQIPKALNKMKGNLFSRLFNPTFHKFSFIASSIESSQNRIDQYFLKYFQNHPNCDIFFKTADNSLGGLFDFGDVYIYPTTREGIGLTITEAMSTGMPVVTPDYPTMNEWISNNKDGKLIKISKIKKSSMPMDKVFIDTSHLADIMLNYIKYPEQIEQQSINARDKIENKFNWDDRDEIILKLFDFN